MASNSSSSSAAASAESASASNSSSAAEYLRRFHVFSGSSESDEGEDNGPIMQEIMCPKGKFARSSKCLSCSLCGPDLYVREACQWNSDTICDWCYNERAVQNRDFQLKCFEVVKIHNGFEQVLRRQSRRHPTEKELRIDFVEIDPAPYVSFTTVREPFSLSKLSPQAEWKFDMLCEAILYLCLLILVGVSVYLLLVVVRVVSFSKRAPHYRTVTVNPPLLDEQDTKNIIRAAEEIVDKIGKKGYERLEEVV